MVCGKIAVLVIYQYLRKTVSLLMRVAKRRVDTKTEYSPMTWTW
jgi:hypothetical protein